MSDQQSNAKNASDTPWLDDLLNAAAVYFMLKQNSKTPNFYQQPLTPNEQWKTDTTKDLYGRVNDYVTGLINNTNLNPTGFQFMSPMFKGMPFAGGIQLGAAKPTFGSNSANQKSTYPGQDLPAMQSNNVGTAQNSDIKKFTPNMRQWEPASGFPMSPSSPQTDPNAEVSLDRANHPLANLNPTGSNGSLFQTGRDVGAGWAAGQPGSGFDTNGMPAGMTRGEGVAGVSWLSNQIRSNPSLAKLGTGALTAFVTATWGPAAGLIAKYGPSVIQWIVSKVTGSALPTTGATLPTGPGVTP